MPSSNNTLYLFAILIAVSIFLVHAFVVTGKSPLYIMVFVDALFEVLLLINTYNDDKVVAKDSTHCNKYIFVFSHYGIFQL